MIAQLTGRVKIFPDYILVDVGGVGYQVFVAPKTQSQLSPESIVTLAIYTHVKEDALELYGFTNHEERRLFEIFLSVSGVGPRTALGIINHPIDLVVAAVQEADVAFFTRVPRVGKKLAQKIIIELKNKLGGIKELQLGTLSSQANDVVAGLIALGYDEVDADSAVRQLGAITNTQQALKEALHLLTAKNELI